MFENSLEIKSNCYPRTAIVAAKLCSTFTSLLNISRDGDSTTSMSSLFQCFITLSVKKVFLTSNLNLPWCNSRPFSLNLSLLTGNKRKTQVQHIHSLSLVLQVGHPVIGGDQLSQAAPAIHKTKLSGPDSLVVLHVPCDGSQNDLFCHLPLAQEARLTDL